MGIEEIKDGYRLFMKLNVVRFRSSDAGGYSCVSKNSFGTDEGVIQLYETDYKPRVEDDYYEENLPEDEDLVDTAVNDLRGGNESAASTMSPVVINVFIFTVVIKLNK